MSFFRHLSRLLDGIGPAIEKDLEEFERESLKSFPGGYTETVEVTSETHNGVLVKVSKVVRKTRKVTL